VGRPTNTSREFWKNSLSYEPSSRQVIVSNKALNVPTMSLTVGAFDSVVPTMVLERSAALTARLTDNGSNSTVDETSLLAQRLAASTAALAAVEHFKRYGDYKALDNYLRKLSENTSLQSLLSRADLYSVLNAVSTCMKQSKVYSSLEEAVAARSEQTPCESASK